MTKEQIAACRKLGMTEDEIAALAADDKRIDKGEKLFELTAEQEKASKQARQVNHAPTVYKLDNTAGKRSKKADNDKRFLMFLIQNAIEQSPNTANFELTNVERECAFHYNGKKYKIVLSAPRS